MRGITGKVQSGAKADGRWWIRGVVERRYSEVEFHETSCKEHWTWATVGATETTRDLARPVFTHLHNIAHSHHSGVQCSKSVALLRS